MKSITATLTNELCYPTGSDETPREKDLLVPEFDREGNKCGEYPYPGYSIKKEKEEMKKTA